MVAVVRHGPTASGPRPCHDPAMSRRRLLLYRGATQPLPNDHGPIKGLSMGADDCLAQPFAPQELVLRVGAILRRLTAPALTARGRLVVGPVMVDETSHRVQVNGADVDLTTTEFKLLRALIER